MATLRHYSYTEVVLDGTKHSIGSLTDPVEISVSGELLYDRTFSVATTAKQLIFSVSNVDLADFDFLVVLSDKDDVVLELVTDDGNEVGERVGTYELRANVPFVLGSDDSYANHTVDFAAGTLDSVETLRVKNNNSATARIRVMAVT